MAAVFIETEEEQAQRSREEACMETEAEAQGTRGCQQPPEARQWPGVNCLSETPGEVNLANILISDSCLPGL